MTLRGEQGQLLIVELAEVGPAGTPAARDLLLDVKVDSRGYAATDQAWVIAADWSRFLSEFRSLERLRTGTATLLGASPDELRLVFGTRDRAGHTLVTGMVASLGVGAARHRLEFGFNFDAGVLLQMLREFEGFSAGHTE
jgi:hypothetical protein